MGEESWERKVVPVGNSLGVRIPNQVFQKTHFKEGDEVAVEIQGEDAIIISRKEDEAP